MSLGRSLRRRLKLDAPAPPFPGRWHDRHAIARLLDSTNLELERDGRCGCPGSGVVRCLEDAEPPPPGLCRACRELCLGDTPD